MSEGCNRKGMSAALGRSVSEKEVKVQASGKGNYNRVPKQERTMAAWLATQKRGDVHSEGLGKEMYQENRVRWWKWVYRGLVRSPRRGRVCLCPRMRSSASTPPRHETQNEDFGLYPLSTLVLLYHCQ